MKQSAWCTREWRIARAGKEEVQATQPRSRDDAPAEEWPVCLRCCTPVDVGRHYCTHCGAPVGAYTLFLPFENIRAYGDFIARTLRISFRGNGLSRPARLLGLVLVLIAAPVLLLLLPFALLNRRRASAGPENELTNG